MSVLHQIAVDYLAAPSPAPTPSCPNAPELCRYLYDQTGSVWLAQGSYLLLVKPLRILLIVALAILARKLINRTISRIVRGTTNDKSSALLRPLRSKIPHSVRDATGAQPERRRQRAEALGSVLRSISSATIFVVAVMLVLSELGINLAPLLASAGIAGLAIGFGAQNLVKDFIAGLFMLLEDQYGVGDVIDAGQASGTVESVGLRVTTIRDVQGILWYIRNGEIVRVGNKSQGWALVVIDVPVGFAGVEEATEILRAAAAGLAEDPDWSEDLIEAPEVLGVEQITVDGAVLRTTVKTTPDARWRVGREMRRRLTEALESGGIAAKLGTGRVILHPPVEANPAAAIPGPAASPAGPAGSPADAGVAPTEAAAPAVAAEIAPPETAVRKEPSTAAQKEPSTAAQKEPSTAAQKERPAPGSQRSDDRVNEPTDDHVDRRPGAAGKEATEPTTGRTADRPADRPRQRSNDQDEQTADNAVTSAATSPAVAEELTESSRMNGAQ